jgi:hypothetical protein
VAVSPSVTKKLSLKERRSPPRSTDRIHIIQGELTMIKNVGGMDRVVRMLAGIALIALAATEQIGLWGWIVGGMVLATGVFSFSLS